MKMKFTAQLVGHGPKGAWVFLPVPFDVLAVFGSRSRVPVAGTLNGSPFKTSLMPNGDGTHSMWVNKQLQAGANAKAGDSVKVVMYADKEPRTVSVPDDLKAGLSRSGMAGQTFARLAYTHQKEFVNWITGAKKPETRERRLKKTLEMLVAGERLSDR